MTGYSTVVKIKRLEQCVDKLGMRMGEPKHSFTDSNTVSLYPKDSEALPIYSRDCEIFEGSLEALEVWLRGFQAARDYDIMLFGSKHDRNRSNKEQQVRNKHLLQKIKEAGETK